MPDDHATEPHPAQLLVCHERIAAPRGYVRRDEQPPWQWCSLSAASWCFDDGYYVCDIHAESRHRLHNLQSVADEQADPPGAA